MENGNTQKYRLEQLEKNYDGLDDKIDKIMTNHLPHIHEELIKLNTQVKVFATVNVGAVIVAILLQRFL
jgi:hypothetical protein